MQFETLFFFLSELIQQEPQLTAQAVLSFSMDIDSV